MAWVVGAAEDRAEVIANVFLRFVVAVEDEFMDAMQLVNVRLRGPAAGYIPINLKPVVDKAFLVEGYGLEALQCITNSLEMQNFGSPYIGHINAVTDKMHFKTVGG